MGVVDSLWAAGNKYTRNDLGDVNEVALTEDEQDVLNSILISEKERYAFLAVPLFLSLDCSSSSISLF